MSDEPRKIITFDESKGVKKPTYHVVQGRFNARTGEKIEINSIHFTYDKEEADISLSLVKKNPLFPKGTKDGVTYKYGIQEGYILINPDYAKEFGIGGENE